MRAAVHLLMFVLAATTVTCGAVAPTSWWLAGIGVVLSAFWFFELLTDLLEGESQHEHE